MWGDGGPNGGGNGRSVGGRLSEPGRIEPTPKIRSTTTTNPPLRCRSPLAFRTAADSFSLISRLSLSVSVSEPSLSDALRRSPATVVRPVQFILICLHESNCVKRSRDHQILDSVCVLVCVTALPVCLKRQLSLFRGKIAHPLVQLNSGD